MLLNPTVTVLVLLADLGVAAADVVEAISQRQLGVVFRP